MHVLRFIALVFMGLNGLLFAAAIVLVNNQMGALATFSELPSDAAWLTVNLKVMSVFLSGIAYLLAIWFVRKRNWEMVNVGIVGAGLFIGTYIVELLTLDGRWTPYDWSNFAVFGGLALAWGVLSYWYVTQGGKVFGEDDEPKPVHGKAPAPAIPEPLPAQPASHPRKAAPRPQQARPRQAGPPPAQGGRSVTVQVNRGGQPAHPGQRPAQPGQRPPQGQRPPGPRPAQPGQRPAQPGGRPPQSQRPSGPRPAGQPPSSSGGPPPRPAPRPGPGGPPPKPGGRR